MMGLGSSFPDMRLPVLLDFKSIFAFAAGLAILFAGAGCEVERRKSDAELGLSPQQAAGRRIYDDRCERCHEAYSSRDKKGPSLQGVFKKQYLAKSGLPANDQQAGDIVRYGRNNMPGYSQALSDQQIQTLLAYLHTL
jgi:mono/diheme cytochrome c family protein